MVLESKYNRIFGVHNDILGLLFYIAASILTALVVIEVGPLGTWNFLFSLMVVGAAIMSIAFTYLQWRVIKSWCFWCVMSAITVAIMVLIIALAGFQYS